MFNGKQDECLTFQICNPAIPENAAEMCGDIHGMCGDAVLNAGMLADMRIDSWAAYLINLVCVLLKQMSMLATSGPTARTRLQASTEEQQQHQDSCSKYTSGESRCQATTCM